MKAPTVIFKHGCSSCKTAFLYLIAPAAAGVALIVQLLRVRAAWVPFGPVAQCLLTAAFFAPWFQKELSTYTHYFGLWRIDMSDGAGCSDYVVIAIVAGVHLVAVPFVISSKHRLAAIVAATTLAAVIISLMAVYRRDMTVAGEGQAPFSTEITSGVYLFGLGAAFTVLAIFDIEVSVSGCKGVERG